MTHEEREQALSEEDYIELRHRFGTAVESVVRDMVNGKGERWEQAQADGNNVFKMRDATPEERESIDKYIKSISKPTGIEFDEEQEQLDFVQPHKQNPVTLTIEGDAVSGKDGYCAVENWLKQLPTVVIPNKTGKWLFKEVTEEYHVIGQCSKCKERRRIDYYCSNCGAKMD